jgi:hypothetical protein
MSNSNCLTPPPNLFKEMGVDLKVGGEWTTTKCRTMVSVKGKNNMPCGWTRHGRRRMGQLRVVKEKEARG